MVVKLNREPLLQSHLESKRLSLFFETRGSLGVAGRFFLLFLSINGRYKASREGRAFPIPCKDNAGFPAALPVN